MHALERPIAVRVAAACRLLGFSTRTAESYGHRLVVFEDWIGQSAMEVDQVQAAAWLTAASRPGARRTTFHNRCALAFLFRHLHGQELDRTLIPMMRCPPARVRRVADPIEIARTFACLANEPSRRLCRLIYGTGMRISEALGACIGDIDASDGSLLVRLGKGGRQRRTIMPAGLRAMVAGYARGWPASAPIVTRDGRPDGQPPPEDLVRASLAQARRKAGVGPHLTVHQLRHCFATHLHERGVGLVELMRMLGHTSVATTVHYIGLRDERRADIARVGDLDAALPAVGAFQQRIGFGT